MSKLSDKIKIIQITRNKYIEQLNLPRITKDEKIPTDDLIKPISILYKQKEIKVETTKRSGLQQNAINHEFSEEELSKLYSAKQNLLNFIITRAICVIFLVKNVIKSTNILKI